MVDEAVKGGTISVVAGGWSMTQVDLARIPGRIIAVNDAAVHLPYSDEIVSMDRLWTEHRWSFIKQARKQTFLRKNAVQNLNLMGTQDFVTVFNCDHESNQFTTQHGFLNGPNSGYCALNRAYNLTPRALFLFGFDMRKGPANEPYWYPAYPWAQNGGTKDGKYRQWTRDFEVAAAYFAGIGCKVINVNTRSLITSFEMKTPMQLDMQRREPA